MQNKAALLILSMAAGFGPSCMSGPRVDLPDLAEPADSYAGYEPAKVPLAEGTWEGGLGMGFSLDPDTFLTTLSAEKAIDDNFTVGPLIQFGNSDDDTIFALSAQIKRYIDLDQTDVVRPYAQLGAGFAFLDKEEPNGVNRDGVGFLFNVGIGADFPIDEKISIGTSMLFNMLPAKVAGENFFFSWQILMVKFSF